MKRKHWKLCLLGFVVLILVIETLVTIKVFIPSIELGSVSDWFSTLFNGIVACTAIVALYKANDYFKEKLTEEDIILWVQINASVSAIASSVTILWLLYSQMIEQWKETNDTEILKHNFLYYIAPRNDFTCQLHKLDEFNYRLSTRAKSYDKKELLASLIKELNTFNSIVLNQTQQIETILKYSNNSSPFEKKVIDRFIESANKNLTNPYFLNEKLQETYDILKKFGIDDYHLKGFKL